MSNGSQSPQPTRQTQATRASNPIGQAPASGIPSTSAILGTPKVTGQNSIPGIGDELKRTLGRLEIIMEEFRDQKITAFKARGDIYQELDTLSNVSDDDREKHLHSYFDEITSFSINPTLPAGASSPGNGTSAKAVTVSKANEVDDLIEKVSEGDEPSSKRRRVREEEMPWFRPDVSRRPSCEESCKILKRFGDDLTGSKTLLRCAVGLPEGIPSSQWEKIIKGEPVDLNFILSSLHYISLDEERKGRIGESEIILGMAEAKRQVKTSSDWSSAFRNAARAIAFVFPHREQELFAYANYIERLFSSKQTHAHRQIIFYDIAIRNEVGGGQNHLLTDFESFSHLFQAIVASDGVEYGHGGNGGGSKRGAKKSGGGGKPNLDGGKSDGVCNRFNGQSGCKFSEDDCNYKHTCKGCGKTGHGKSACPDKQ